MAFFPIKAFTRMSPAQMRRCYVRFLSHLLALKEDLGLEILEVCAADSAACGPWCKSDKRCGCR